MDFIKAKLWTKKLLIDALAPFKDDDDIVINVHDTVLYEDNYNFAIDPIHMGLDGNNKDRGYEIQLCPVQNQEPKEVEEKKLFKFVHTHKHGTDEFKFKSTTDYCGYFNEGTSSEEDLENIMVLAKKLDADVEFFRGECVDIVLDSTDYKDVD